MALHWSQLPKDSLALRRRGTVIPAHPLALDAKRRFDPRRQRALTRYYVDAGDPVRRGQVLVRIDARETDAQVAAGAANVAQAEAQLVQAKINHERTAKLVESRFVGQSALDKADALVPDLVLLDAMLPKVHGFDACRRIKASARTRHVPVIMMTAIYRGWRFAQDARESYGAFDYVEKPFRLEDLLRRMEAALLSGADRPAAPGEGEEPSTLVQRGKELLASGKAADAVAVLPDAVRAAEATSAGLVMSSLSGVAPASVTLDGSRAAA